MQAQQRRPELAWALRHQPGDASARPHSPSDLAYRADARVLVRHIARQIGVAHALAGQLDQTLAAERQSRVLASLGTRPSERSAGDPAPGEVVGTGGGPGRHLL